MFAIYVLLSIAVGVVMTKTVELPARRFGGETDCGRREEQRL